MNQPQRSSYRHFTPWRDHGDRSCWTCAHATGYDGVRAMAKGRIEEHLKRSGLMP